MSRATSLADLKPLHKKVGDQYNRYCQSAAVVMVDSGNGVDEERSLSWRIPGVTTHLQEESEQLLPHLLGLPEGAFEFGGIHLLFDDDDNHDAKMQFHRHRDGTSKDGGGDSLDKTEIIVLVMVGDGENTFVVEHDAGTYHLRRRGGDVVIMTHKVRRMYHMVSPRGE